ncbi:MAG: hypothetical protein LKG35_03415, partial [Olsenella sp.]|nr:hypothetical protein [Olsenella sp.]
RERIPFVANASRSSRTHPVRRERIPFVANASRSSRPAWRRRARLTHRKRYRCKKDGTLFSPAYIDYCQYVARMDASIIVYV